MTIIISDEAVNIALNTWLGGVPAWRNDATERLRDEMRAALTAAAPHLAAVQVKKLAWGDNFHWRGVEKAYVHSDYNGHIGVICRHGVAGTPFSGRDAPTHWRPLPSAPSQEVAGS